MIPAHIIDKGTNQYTQLLYIMRISSYKYIYIYHIYIYIYIYIAPAFVDWILQSWTGQLVTLTIIPWGKSNLD
jgi:hypothetical protein